MNEDKREILKRRVYNIRQGVSQIPYFKNLPCKIDEVDEGWVELSLTSMKTFATIGELHLAGFWRPFVIPLWVWQVVQRGIRLPRWKST